MSATLRYEACSDSKISSARRYKDPIFTRHDVHPYVTNNQASLFTAIKLELIQTCPSTKIQSITASETCLKFLQPTIMIHRKSEDHLSPNMSDLTQVITYKQTCRRPKGSNVNNFELLLHSGEKCDDLHLQLRLLLHSQANHRCKHFHTAFAYRIYDQ